jgi:hypothetical protein
MSSKSKYCVGLLESNMAGSEFVLKTPEKPDYIDVLGENGSGGGSSGDESQEWQEFLGLKFVSEKKYNFVYFCHLYFACK